MFDAAEARSLQDTQYGIGSVSMYNSADVKLNIIQPAFYSSYTRSKPQPPPHPPCPPPRGATAQPTQYRS